MTPRTNGADIVIIGAGIIGCTIARLLALRGADVIVVDGDTPGRCATWAAGGMLSPLIESAADDPFFHLADRSFDLYPALVERVEGESGMSVDYRTSGKLQCALDDSNAAALRRLYDSPRAKQYGLRLLDGDDARAFQPGLSRDVQCALFVERDHCVDNRLFAQAIAASAAAVGVRFMIGSPVITVGGDASGVAGVALASGGILAADTVVVAAGAWSALLERLPTAIPVAPVRGQMLAVDTGPRGADGSAMFECVVGTEACYMIPRSDGRLVIGATVEHVGFDAGPTPHGIAWLIECARAVMPGIAALPLIETWAGYRPGTPDGWPIIGADPAMRGLVHATGHYRNGILLAPVTAEAVASIIDGNAPEWIEPFNISRFGAADG